MKKLLLLTFFFSTTALAQTIPSTGNFIYIDQIGSNNNITIAQTDSDVKQALVVGKGDSNDITITQQGTGTHIAAVSPTNTAPNSQNSNNLLSINQSGTGNHTASILFVDPITNSNNIASIIQAGGVGANKQFTLQLQGSGITANVLQDNATTPNTGSMAIQCLTPPCTGYSYTRR